MDNSAEANRKRLKSKIEFLRSSRCSTTQIPVVDDKLRAGYNLDILENGKTLSIPGKKIETVGSKQDTGNLAVVGADVRSLFPSLKRIESA